MARLYISEEIKGNPPMYLKEGKTPVWPVMLIHPRSVLSQRLSPQSHVDEVASVVGGPHAGMCTR